MLPELLAQQQLHAIEAASAPHATGQWRADLHRKYADMLGDQQPRVRGAEATAALARAGFHVRRVPKKVTDG